MNAVGIHVDSAKKLGKAPPRFDVRTANFADFTTSLLPAAPPARDYTDKLPANLGMMGNDKYGCCGFAGMGHATQVWTSENGSTITPSDTDVLAAYSGCTGFKIGDSSTDNGVVLLDALKYWRSTGIGGHKIGAFLKVDQHNLNHVRIAINLFGGLYTGVNLPLSAQKPGPWIGTRGHFTHDQVPGSWGGHCVAPSTRVITADLRWVSIGDIHAGDRLLGFDEHRVGGLKRRWRASTVEAVKELKLPSYQLEFSDGSRVRCSDDHMWLVRTSDGGSRWAQTRELVVANDDRRGSVVMKALQPWREDTSYDAGYLAAAFDGEGWVDGESSRGIHKIGFCQKTNPMWSNVLRILDERGIVHHDRVSTTGFAQSEVNNLVIHGRQQLLEFLGGVRPRRLLGKLNVDQLGAFQCHDVELLMMESVGEQPVTALQTDTRTYVAEGLASHNCVWASKYDHVDFGVITWGERQAADEQWWLDYTDETYAIVSVDWVTGAKPAPNGFNLTKLLAYLQKL